MVLQDAVEGMNEILKVDNILNIKPAIIAAFECACMSERAKSKKPNACAENT